MPNPAPLENTLRAPRRALRVAGTLARVLGRRSVLIAAAAALLVAGDFWMAVTIRGYEDQSDTLLLEASSFGETVSALQGHIETISTEVALDTSQRQAAIERAADVGEEAATALAKAEPFRDAALDLKECADDLQRVMDGLWAHGREFVATLWRETNAECANATAYLNRLLAETN